MGHNTTPATVDHDAMRAELAGQAAAFIANPAGWPAAMAARAMRLRSGHPAYSPTNQTLILCQLWSRLSEPGMTDDESFSLALAAAAEETAPASVWKTRGYLPAGPGLWIWSKPFQVWTDAAGKRVPPHTPDATARTVFRMERTYLARDVRDTDGRTGVEAFTAPELPAGAARDIFQRLATWAIGQGWTVERSGRDMRESGYTQHAGQRIVVHGGLTEWPAVETLAHELAHAFLHGADDARPYAGEHRGDMEAEAESVAFGFLHSFGQADLARGSARYAVEWTGSPERVAIAYERASHVLDALVAVAMGQADVTVAESAKAAKLAAKADNKQLAAQLRDAGLEPRGDAWRRAKAGEPIADIARDLTAA